MWRPDLPGDDDAAGLREYADTVVGAIGNGGDLVVVGMSLGGFTAPLVADQLPVEVLVTRMIPVPGERADDWFSHDRLVGYHLYKAFPKLGVTSRAELAHLDLDAILTTQ